MIITITNENRVENSSIIEALFRVRYEHFVLRRGWSYLSNTDHIDIDAYDDADTDYIVKLDAGKIVGGARLRPTTIPHMLDEVFGFLCRSGRAPHDIHIGECSRTFVDRRYPSKRSIFVEVLLGVAQHSLKKGYSQLTGVLETWWLNSYLAVGLTAMPLGVPQEYEGMSLMAVSFPVDEHVCAGLAARLESLKLISNIRCCNARSVCAEIKNERRGDQR